MYRLIALLIGYALGHVQTSYILGKILKGIDIREHGSRSAGMTNSLRVMGGKIAAVVLLVDVLKAFGAFLIAAAIFGGSGSFFSFGGGEMGVLPGIYGAMGAVLGHMFPVYMKFRGGKSVACAIGLVLAMHFGLAGMLLGVAALIVAAFRMISLASIISSALLPPLLMLLGFETEAIIVSIFLAALLIFKHKANIGRLIRREENKLGQKI